MITYRNKIIGSGKWLLRLLLCAAIIHCPLSIIHCKAQPQLSLEQAIRQAQDSTIIAFQSQHEYDYYQLHYDEFTALRKPQLTLRVAPNYSRLVSDLSRDYVYLRNYDNLSAAASVKLTQKMLNWGGEAYIGTQAIWSEYFNSQATEARQFMAAPLLVGYRQTLLGYNPYRWEKAVEDQRLKAARQQHEYDKNRIAEEVTQRFFRLVCTQGELEMYQSNLQTADTLCAIAREKASIAMVTIAELRSMELQRVNVANALAMARTEEEVARTQLASFLRLCGDSLSPTMRLEYPRNPKNIKLSTAQAIDMALANSPVYQHQIATLTESRHQEQKAYKEKGINVALDVNVGMQQVDNVLGHAFRDQKLYALGAVTLSVPLMDHGAAKSRHAAAKAWVEREESALDEAERTLREDVTSTMYDISTYRLLLERTSEAVDMANEVFDMNANQDYPNNFVAAPITEEDIFYQVKPGDAEHIINAKDGSLVTGHEVWHMGASMFSDTHPWLEVEKIVVYNRYQPGAKPMVGLIHGFGISNGAIAGSVAHDCHNIVAIGSNDGYIVRAVNRVIEMGGGLVVVSADEENDIPLPIAGLMAPLSGYEIAFRTMMLCEMVRDIGCTMKSPFITMAFMALPVIPNLKLTDRHLMDTKNMQIIR